MSEPMIRVATTADVHALAWLRRADTIERRGVTPDADPDFEARFAHWMTATDHCSVSWLAEADSQPAGMLQMFVHARMPMPDRDPGGWAYIGVLFVRPDHRNVGLGRRLLDAALTYAEEQGLSRVLLHPTERAMSFYRRAGLEPADRYLVWTAAQQPGQSGSP
ncbi:GNAT family N-acetyltransferase [Actinopolymorpha sp. B9G3]|uniref:GNAT family N-acetyltransferase n=1 Tax=Actinopolymorpha sp. B9G3 TaxID=3158970 RepID=UPI0032D90FC3